MENKVLEEKKRLLEELRKKKSDINEIDNIDREIDKINLEISQSEFRKKHPLATSFSSKYMNVMRKTGNAFKTIFKQKVAYGFQDKDKEKTNNQKKEGIKKDTVEESLNWLE